MLWPLFSLSGNSHTSFFSVACQNGPVGPAVSVLIRFACQSNPLGPRVFWYFLFFTSAKSGYIIPWHVPEWYSASNNLPLVPVKCYINPTGALIERQIHLQRVHGRQYCSHSTLSHARLTSGSSSLEGLQEVSPSCARTAK